ncbi:MAG: rhomboid family intramembrane serine protease [Chlamydiota bacterium]
MKTPVTLLLIAVCTLLFFASPPAEGFLFGHILEGQIWRLISPILLHGNIFHLFLNVTWLFFFGSLVEEKIGSFRYILLILIVAAFSNTAQYLVSGPYFLGLSGVLMGLVGFIWARRRIENWPVPKATLLMVTWIICIMAAVEGLFILLERFKIASFSTHIANTAHIVGALTGFIVGLIPYFKERSYERT